MTSPNAEVTQSQSVNTTVRVEVEPMTSEQRLAEIRRLAKMRDLCGYD
jgi:hypothetical protein